MKVFENKVGRPSNETLKKRRTVKTLIVCLVVFVLALCSFLTYTIIKSFNVSGESKNISAGGVEVSVAGRNGGFIIGSKYYKKTEVSLGSNVSISTKKDAVGSNVIYVASDGKTKLDFKTVVGNDLKKKVGGSYSKVVLQTLNSSGKAIETKTTNIKSNTVTPFITIKKATNKVKISVMQATTNGAKQIFSKTINVSTLPIVTPKLVDKATKNSSGVYVVKNNGNNKINFKLDFTSGHTMYYSVFTYNGHTLTSSNVDKTLATCVAFNKSMTTPDYTVSVTTQAAVRLRIYNNLNTCKSDTKAKYASPSDSNKTVIKESSIKYSSKFTTTNSDGYVTPVNYDKAAIGKKIGSQTSSACKQYAYKYAYYIKYGKTTTGYDPVCTTYSNESDLISKIKTSIDNGTALMVFFSNNFGEYKQHWGVAVGYKPNEYNKVTHISQIMFLDPYSSSGYGKKGASILWAGPIFNSDHKNIHSTMLKLKNNTYCYVK